MEEAGSRGKRRAKLRKIAAHLPQKNSELLSGQYGTNLLLAGLALMLAFSHHDGAVGEEQVLAFISSLMLLQLAWMLWYVVVRGRQKSRALQKDKSAGTSWLRGGLTLLAMLSLIMDAFRIGYYVGHHHCVSVAVAVYPVIHTLHTISQVHFLWFHIKDVIDTHETFERFGVIHAVFTNLLLWCNGIMSEADHFLTEQKKRHLTVENLNLTDELYEHQCNCTSNICQIFSSSLYYLYPFNIEYHILVSAMLFVMWKNIGRTIGSQPSAPKQPWSSRLSGLVVGPILGLLVLAGTIGVLVVYIIFMGGTQEAWEQGIFMFYCYGIVMLSFMCVAGVVGLLIYRCDQQPLDSTKNPARQLDAELLFASSVGAWLMSWCSVVAVVSANGAHIYRWTNFLYSLLLVLEKYVQNLFVIESLYREHVHSLPSPHSPGVFSITPSYNGIINRAYEDPEALCDLPGGDTEENSSIQKLPESPASPTEPRDFPQEPLTPPSSSSSQRWKRHVVKNISTFLLLCNICLWILPAFGCRPQYDSVLEQETYGFSTWTAVLNFAMPVNLFYRMHSVAMLFEVFQRV